MRKEIDMINGPLVKNMFIFGVPIVFTNLLQNLFNAADTVVVGKFAGEDALAAVGATGSLMFLMICLFNGLATGSNVVIAQAIGSGDQDRVKKSVHTSYMIAFLGGIILMIAGMAATYPLLRMTSTPDNIIDKSALYMRICFAGAIFVVVYNMGASVLRAKGDTKRPLYFLAFSGVLNVTLNLIFVIVLKMSVAGVALATDISQLVSAILVTVALMKDRDATHFSFKDLGIDKKLCFEILRIGLPAGIQGMMFSISNIVVQKSINSFDNSTIIAGNTAGNNLESFVYIGMMAFTQAAMTFISQNYGAKQFKKISKITYTSLSLACISAVAMSSIVYVLRYPLLSLYTSEELVVEVAIKRIIFVVLPLILNAILDIFASALRGMGNSTIPTIVMIIGICGVRLAYIAVFFPIFKTLESIYMCFPISWAITSLLMYALYLVKYKQLLKENNMA